ncbi:MAG: DNA polymerase delta subunit 2 [Lasallia pustulata]|uniref:DNA polymerase delta subunit 2 n=1 Tax=Lasallia pustulata TaxID=136370 RepID=A0A5M8PL24_9LECA|nr:MAG: DNA polymerase delta subunit 2 [Lasallia pustulata]
MDFSSSCSEAPSSVLIRTGSCRRRNAATAGSEEPGWFDSVTNPWEGDVDGWRLMGTGGQPVDDVYKAPTAPDTLWCYPFQEKDQFVIEECPHVYFVGNQPKFETTVIEGPAGQNVRLIAVPRFKERGEVVLLEMDSLDVETVKFDVYENT